MNIKPDTQALLKIDLLLEKIQVIYQELASLHTSQTMDNKSSVAQEISELSKYINSSLSRLRSDFSELLSDDIGQLAAPMTTYQPLGILSSKYESNGYPGEISTGQGDTGGISYGAYQLSSNMGVVDDFLNWLISQHHPIAERLTNAGAVNTDGFIAAWKNTADNYPKEFYQLQHNYIAYSHYQPVIKELAAAGIDITSRSKALQEVVWSMAVQVNNYTPDIFASALNGREFSSVTDLELIPLLYQYRNNYFSASSADIRESLTNRFADESKQALLLLNIEQRFTEQIQHIKNLLESIQASSHNYNGLDYLRENLQPIYHNFTDQLELSSSLTTLFGHPDPLIIQGIINQQAPVTSCKDTNTPNVINNIVVNGVTMQNPGSDIDSNTLAIANQTADYLNQQSMYLWKNRILNGTPLFG